MWLRALENFLPRRASGQSIASCDHPHLRICAFAHMHDVYRAHEGLVGGRERPTQMWLIMTFSRTLPLVLSTCANFCQAEPIYKLDAKGNQPFRSQTGCQGKSNEINQFLLEFDVKGKQPIR